MALLAAIFGWLFDGLEMGLFPLIARPAMYDLLGTSAEGEVGLWISVMNAGFLVGAATGGVLFGWLGDRIGRVRAMTLSVLTYAVFTGLCGLAGAAEQVFVSRFIASLGMGGEWSLGVSLVMEIWPEKSRGWLAGLIGAAANVGFIAIAIVSLGLSEVIHSLESGLLAIGISQSWVEHLVSNSGWRLLMLFGAAPALLTFFIRLFVPESERWLHGRGTGATSHWATRDLLGVLFGAIGPLSMIYLWATDHGWLVRTVGSVIGLVVAYVGYTHPVRRYLQRAVAGGTAGPDGARSILKRMLAGACLSGVALLGTWGAIQLGPSWADQLSKQQGGTVLHAKEFTQIALGVGAIVGTIIAAMAGHRIKRRLMYSLLCLSALGSALLFFLANTQYGTPFLCTAFVAGACTASFYGWLPLYLPEIFPTVVRATGQGFAFNFGRILAAVGALQTGYLMNEVFDGNYPQACSVISLVYLLGLVAVWAAPETQGEALPE